MMSTALLVKGHYRCPFRSCQLHHWMTILKFWPKPIPRLFFRYQIFRNQNQGCFSETKFSETETETFFQDQIFRNRNRDFFSETKFSKTETETFFPRPNLQNWYRNPPKIGKSLETETETETSQYPWDIFSKYFPPFPLVFFSSRKKIFSFFKYFPSSSGIERQCQCQCCSLCFPPSNR